MRIGYIDLLRGLCIVSIVWYHTDHPAFLNYPFYNTTLFFVSGMTLNVIPFKVFLRKKVQRLLIPFCFFYVFYYLFLIALNYVKYHFVLPEILSSIFDVFRWYNGNDGYICNYPLWFIWALFWVQMISVILIKVINNSVLLFFVAFAISAVGSMCISHVSTPFFLGRSLTFVFYYVAGFVFAKQKVPKKYNIVQMAVVAMLSFLLMNSIDSSVRFIAIISMILGFVSMSVFLLCICVMIDKFSVAFTIKFLGINSLIVFGLHDMYLTILRIITQNLIGEMNLWLGLLNWIVTLFLMIPIISFLNKYLPFLVGKIKTT